MSDQPGWQQTRRLPPDRSQDQGEPGRRLDAVGDSTYEDDDGYAGTSTEDPYASTAYAEDQPAEEDSGQRTSRSGWRSALLVLVGVVVGFVAALVVVALFGGDTGDTEAVEARDARIAELQTALEEAESENAALADALEQREEELEAALDAADSATDDIEAQQEALSERAETLDEREETLEERAEALDQREQALDQGEQQPAEGGEDDADPAPAEDSGVLPDTDIDLPDLDEEDAEALVDRVIDRLRELFR